MQKNYRFKINLKKKRYRLSKSTFISGLQCEKSFYFYKHHYKLKDPTPKSLQPVFDQEKLFQV